MQISRSREHLADEVLLAYLDGEMSNMRMRAIRTHLKTCWKCRSALAELESQAEAISHLLAEKSNDEIDRSLQAREKFLRWRTVFENRQRFFFRCQPPQLMRNGAGAVLA
jgi:anti-sigma factor RsiW